MAKKEQPLTFTEIVLRAEADVIRQAHEARVKIDDLLAERAKAYEAIAALEEQVDSVLGESDVFPFPAPPMPVAGFGAKAMPASRPKVKKAAPKAAPTAPEVDASTPEPEASDSDPSAEANAPR